MSFHNGRKEWKGREECGTKKKKKKKKKINFWSCYRKSACIVQLGAVSDEKCRGSGK
jgi:hypothetical protein